MKNKTNSNTNKEEFKINIDKDNRRRQYEVTYSIPIEGEKKQFVILLDYKKIQRKIYKDISFANMNDKKFNTTDLLIDNDLFQADETVKTQEEDLKRKYKNYVFVETPESDKQSEYKGKLKEKQGTIDTRKYKNVKISVGQHGPSQYIPYKDILQQLKSTNHLNSLYVNDMGCNGRNNIKELYDNMIEKSKNENGIFLFSIAKNDHSNRSYAKHSNNRMPSYEDENRLVDPVIKKIIGKDTLKELYDIVHCFVDFNHAYYSDYEKNQEPTLNKVLRKYNIDDGVLKNILEQCIKQNIKNEEDIISQQNAFKDCNKYVQLEPEQDQSTFIVNIYNYIIQNNKNDKIEFIDFLKELQVCSRDRLTEVFSKVNNALVSKAMFDFNLFDKMIENRVKEINENLSKNIKDIKINQTQLREILSVFVGNKIEKTLFDTINNYYWFFKGNMYKIPHSCIEKRRKPEEFYQEILNNIDNLEKIVGNEVVVEKAITEDFNNYKKTNYIKWNKLEEKEKKDLIKQVRIATLIAKLEQKYPRIKDVETENLLKSYNNVKELFQECQRGNKHMIDYIARDVFGKNNMIAEYYQACRNIRSKCNRHNLHYGRQGWDKLSNIKPTKAINTNFGIGIK